MRSVTAVRLILSERARERSESGLPFWAAACCASFKNKRKLAVSKSVSALTSASRATAFAGPGVSNPCDVVPLSGAVPIDVADAHKRKCLSDGKLTHRTQCVA